MGNAADSYLAAKAKSGSKGLGPSSAAADSYLSGGKKSGGKSKGGHGIGGFFSNLGSDVEQTITGLGPGLLKTGHDLVLDSRDNGLAIFGDAPKGFRPGAQHSRLYNNEIKPIGKSYAETYGPLFHGDFGKFGHNVYQHPLGPALDALSVATLGEASATKLGLLSKAGDSLALRSPAALAGQEGTVVSKAVTGSGLTRRLRLAADSALKRLPPDMRVVGEHARYGRTVKIQELTGPTGTIGKELALVPHQVALGNLSKPEFFATQLLHDFPTRSLVDAELSRLEKVPGAETQVRAFSDPKVLALVDNPSPKMIRALGESQKLTEKDLALKVSGKVVRSKGGRSFETPALSQEAADLRRYQPALVARGAVANKAGELVAPSGETIPGMVQEIKQEITDAGRHQPIYRPQHSIEETGGTATGVGGSGIQNSPIKNNKAILQTMGKVNYATDSLTPAYLRTIKWSTYTDRHADLVDSAVSLAPNDAAKRVLSGKWDYVKVHRNESIPYTERTGPGFEDQLQKMFPEGPTGSSSELTGTASDLVTKDASEALTDARGNRLVVPASVRKAITGEYQRSTRAGYRIYNDATKVWRALVLNTNPAWLTHNIVGNTFMWSIANAGLPGLRFLLQAILDTKGPRAVRALLTDKEITSHLTKQDLAEIAPEQVAGTQLGTQNPLLGNSIADVAGKAVQKVTSPLRNADISYEQSLRQSTFNRLVRKSPEFKAAYERLPKEARYFRTAAKKALADNPDLNRYISKQVDDALGNYLGMSEFEQNVLRGTMPFYGWFRAISKITLKLAADTPGRADLLTKIGQIGWGDSVSKLGPGPLEDYIRSIFLTSGTRGLQTQGFNPFQTETQLQGAATSNSQLLGLMNPFIAATIKTLGNTQAKGIGGLAGLPRNLYGQVVSGLPQVRVAAGGKKATPGSSYGDQSDVEALLSFLGFPMKTINVPNSEANYRKYHGR